MQLQQRSTGKKYSLVEAIASDWKDQMPTDLTGGIPVSESHGTVNGSVFCYWLGERSVESHEIAAAIQAHIEDHDIVGLRYIRSLPQEVHPVVREQLSQLIAGAS